MFSSYCCAQLFETHAGPVRREWLHARLLSSRSRSEEQAVICVAAAGLWRVRQEVSEFRVLCYSVLAVCNSMPANLLCMIMDSCSVWMAFFSGVTLFWSSFPQTEALNIITHASSSWCVGRVIRYVREFVCFSAWTLKGKQFAINTKDGIRIVHDSRSTRFGPERETYKIRVNVSSGVSVTWCGLHVVWSGGFQTER